MTTSYLERARSLTPLIMSEAATIERDATVSKVVVDALVENDMFWCMVPERLGGGGIGIVEALQVAEEVSRADGSTGWAYMATAFETAIIAGFVDPKTAEEYFLGDTRAIVAGMLFPRHPGVLTADGYALDGQFSFASGSDFATIIGSGFLPVGEDGNPLIGPSGGPEPRIALIPKGEIEFLGNWSVWGLAGTGSYDYAVRNAVVPERHTIATFHGSPQQPDPVFTIGALAIGTLGHTANALGIATRALQELVTVVTAKARPGYAVPVGESEIFRLEFARKEAMLQAARLYVHDVAGRAEATGAAGQPVTPEHLARIAQAITWTQEVATEVVAFAHKWGGSASIRTDSALGRCMRDANIATQHIVVDPMTLVGAAAGILPDYVLGGSGE